MPLRAGSIVSLVVLSALLAGSALADTISSVFNSGGAVWSGPAQADVREGLAGTTFSCDFSQAPDRCYWDASVSLDLSRSPSTVLWIYVVNADLISNFLLYFHSGGGYYSTYTLNPAFNNGWNRLEVRPFNFAIEGTPGSLANIDMIRVSPWKKAGASGRSDLFFTVGAVPPSVAGLSNITTVFGSPTVPWDPVAPADAPQPASLAKGGGWTFSCDFSRLPPISIVENSMSQTCLWQAGGLQLSLSPTGSLTGWVFVQNAAALWQAQLRLRSGYSYYSWNFNLYEGWNQIQLNARDAFAPSSAFGWDSIDQVGVVLSKLKDERVTVSFADMASSPQAAAPPSSFIWPDADLGLPRQVRRDLAGRLIESRAIFDEAPWFLSGIDTVLNNIAQAGFNVYIPVVWHSQGAIYASTTTVLDGRYTAVLQAPLDPFGDLIKKAHARGIQVHPWFTVALRETNIYPQFAPAGSPDGAFDMQDPAFRDFIVNKVILDVARRYDIDGIVLDYIRTIGVSFTPTARALYMQKYGMDIDELKNPASSPAVTARFLEWQDAAVTDVVSRVSAWIKANKPWVVLSISGHPLPQPQMSDGGRNDRNWVTSDLVDIDYGMDYDRRPNSSVMGFVRGSSPHPERFAKILGNYDFIPSANSSVTPWSGAFLGQQVEYFLRKFPGRGIAVYIYSQIINNQDMINGLHSGPFQEIAVPFSNGFARPDGVAPRSPAGLKLTP